jgi:predicted ABC-type ATPase
MDESTYKLDLKTHDTIFKFISKKIFENKFPVQNPTIVILGGQPAAGKSDLIKLSEKEFTNNNVVKINGDEFRKFHPNSKEILKNHDKDYAKLTEPDVRTWTKDLFDKAIDKKYNIIFEGTMRTDQICDTIKNLKDKGFNVIVRALAVNELNSRAAIYQRYINQIQQFGGGRFTERASHDAAYSGMLNTLQRIENERKYDKLEIYKRNGDLVYNSVEGDSKTGVVDSIIKTRNEPWSLDKYKKFLEGCDDIIGAMKSTGEKQEFIDDVKKLKSEAKNLVSGKDLQQLKEKRENIQKELDKLEGKKKQKDKSVKKDIER